MSLSRNDITSPARDIIVIRFSYPLPVEGRDGLVDGGRVVAIGYSNGAPIAASTMLRQPGSLHDAILLSPMLPFGSHGRDGLETTAVFIGAGRRDVEQVDRLTEALESLGARVLA